MMASGWTDLGALYDLSPTCYANEGSKGTRRDYALANAAALSCVIGFRVASGEIPTHKPLVITIRPTNDRRITYTHTTNGPNH